MRRILLVILASCAACDPGVRTEDAGFFTFDAMVRNDSGPATSLILVEAVFDGDTISLRAGSSLKSPDGRGLNGVHVRLLGIDAPEIAHPPTPADCWGEESAMFAQTLMGGKFIELEYDQAHELRDQFDRLLAYVILPDSRVANEVLIMEGNARSFRAFQHRDTAKYNALEQTARSANVGLWNCP